MFRRSPMRKRILPGAVIVLTLLSAGDWLALAQNKSSAATPARAPRPPARPKLVAVLVVDQMRADYVDKFRGQWSAGLRRLVEEGAWFRNAAYPYAATETCVGHATISTGALPATHGIIGNAWWDREQQAMVTCTADANAQDLGYAGLSVKGGDSAARLRLPTFADELRFQNGGGAARVVSISLKARAAIMLAGHRADVVTWFDGSNGAWVTSSVYGRSPFVEEYAKAHPAREDYGKTWSLALPPSAYFYEAATTGAIAPPGWGLTFPHALRGKAEGAEPDSAYYDEWAASPFADTALTRLAEKAVDSLHLGQGSGTDFLDISYSSPDLVGHAFGPRSHEIQDILVRLDGDLGELFARLDQKVGRGNYVVALSADHGVVPIPEDMQKTGADAGWLRIPELRARMEKAFEAFHYPKPSVASVTGGEIYFAPGVYERLQQEPVAMRAVLDAIRGVPGIANVYRAEELQDRPATQSPMRNAEAAGYYAGRSGDLLFVPTPYWPYDFFPPGQRTHGTTHGTPYAYDQRVPILLMGWGIQPGEYFSAATPADIAPTLGSLCGITLAPRDGRVLSEALKGSRSSGPKSMPSAPAAQR